MSSVSSRMASLQSTVIADRQFQADCPTAFGESFDVYFKALLKGDSGQTRVKLDAFMHRAKSGAVVNLDLDLDMDFSFEVLGAELMDSDSIYQRSQNDLHGSIQTLTGRVDVFRDRLNTMLRAQLHDLADAALLPEDAGWFDHAKRMGAGLLIESSSLDIAEAQTPDGREAIAITLQTPLKNTQILMHTNEQGQIILATEFDEAGDDFINRQLAKQMNPRLQDALEAMQAELAKLGIQTEVASAHGQYTLTPKAMTLSAEQFKQLTGRALPVSYAQSEIFLTPEDINLSIENGQLQFSIKNIAIKGSSHKQGAQAPLPGQTQSKIASEPTTIVLDRARLTGILDAGGKLRDNVLSDIKGSVQANTNLSPQTLQAIKDRISALVQGVDEQLKTYGLNREQLTAIIGQLPNDLLPKLLSSNNKSDISSAARRLGIDGQQLEGALSFLKEQPYRQLVGDLSRLSNMIEENTQIHGSIDFQLETLSLADGDREFFATLKGITLQAELASTTPEGTKTSGTVAAEVQTLTWSGTEAQLTAAQIHTDLSIQSVGTVFKDPSPQLNAFRKALATPAPNRFVKSDTYLKDEGSEPLRRGKGLSTADVTPLLAKLDNKMLLRLSGLSVEERSTEVGELGLNDRETFYLTVENATVAPQTVPLDSQQKHQNQGRQKIQAHMHLEHAGFSSGTAKLEGLQGTARLDTFDSQECASSSLTLEATMDQVQTRGDQVSVSHRERNEHKARFKARLKAIPEQALLPDEGLAKLRSGIGICAETAHRSVGLF